MTTLANLLTYLSTDYIRDPNDRIRPAATKTRAINIGYRKLQADMVFSAGENELSTTQSLTAGTSQYNKPTLTATISAIVINNSELLLTTFDEVMSMGSIAQGKPYAYYVRANKINYVPTPNTSYTATVYYNAGLDELSTGESSEYPADYDNAILSYAAYHLFIDVQKFDSAQAMKEKYEDAVNVLRMKFFNETNDTMMTM